jgi:poly(hydroxyalkanoate) granule associated protein phasin
LNARARKGRGCSTREEALRTVRESANAAGGTFGRLEQAIEERIARTLNRMGVITRAEVADLSAQVGQLADEMHGLMRQSRSPAAAGSGKRRAKAAKTVKRRAARKKPAGRRAKRR